MRDAYFNRMAVCLSIALFASLATGQSVLLGLLTATTATGTASPTSAPSSSASSDVGDSLAEGDFKFWILIPGALTLIAAFAYVFVVRKRRNAAQLRALNSGTRTWVRGPARRRPVMDTQLEEGFNERGEAPPPYIPGQDETHDASALHEGGIPLQSFYVKPPDYDAGSDGMGESDLDLTRPSAAHPPYPRTTTVRREESTAIDDRGEGPSSREHVE